MLGDHSDVPWCRHDNLWRKTDRLQLRNERKYLGVRYNRVLCKYLQHCDRIRIGIHRYWKMDQADFFYIIGCNVSKFCFSILRDSCTMTGTEVLSSVFDAIYIVRFEMLSMLNIETALFRYVTPWSLVFTNFAVYLLSPYSQFLKQLVPLKSWQLSTLKHDVKTRCKIAGK